MTITENGELSTLPLMLRGYAPNLDKLPTFLLRLGTEVNSDSLLFVFVFIVYYRLNFFLKFLHLKVDWETEIGCFETLSREFGLFYAPEPPNFSNNLTTTSRNQDDNNSMDICDKDTSNINIERSTKEEPKFIFTEQQKKAEVARYKWQIEHLIFPTLKSQFIAPKSIAENGHVLQIANLPDLYRIFERC